MDELRMGTRVDAWMTGYSMWSMVMMDTNVLFRAGFGCKYPNLAYEYLFLWTSINERTFQ
jgi:hypothetical protein